MRRGAGTNRADVIRTDRQTGRQTETILSSVCLLYKLRGRIALLHALLCTARRSRPFSVRLPGQPLPGLVEGALDRRGDELEGLLDVLRLLGRGLRVLQPELLGGQRR